MLRQRHTLFPHQEKALAQIKENSRPALFMQMRLGKTPVIIRWAKHQLWAHPESEGAGRILVVGPLSVLDDWVDELRREGIPRRSIHMLTGPMATRLEYAEGGARGWYLINYEGVRILSRDLSDLDWDAIILDESTHIRNPRAQTTKVLVNQYQQVPLRAILTGDPRPESELDYFEQFRFLLGNFMSYGNYWVFRQKMFRQSAFQEYLWMPLPGTRDKIKTFVHNHAVVMTQKQVGIGGRKIYERRVVDQNNKQKKAIKELIKNFSCEYLETNFATVRDVWLARVAGGFSPDQENPEVLSNAKTQELVDLLQGELRREQVVVWFRFNEELEHVVAALRKAAIHAVGVTGATPVPERKAIRNRFARGDYRAICVQVKLGRFGWDLSSASTAIYYSNAYDWESRSQSQERIVHPAKKKPLLYIDLVTRGTLDEEVVRLLREKRVNSSSFMRQLNSQVWKFLGLEGGHEGQTQKENPRRATAVRRTYPGAK